ncbi:MAG TPA: PilX N-terminal domain-containing pilus assembly protein, partial [Candidatus Binatia bacterium]|nr:PilX N-terminal domain-containing pilus assembly protein [Candidatus Binatia bacterium]
MKLRLRRDEPGVALIAVLLIMALLMGLATALTTSINMDTGLRGAYHRSTAGFYAAESGLNRGMGDYRNIFLNFQIPTGSNFNPTTLTVGNRSVTYQITDATVYDAYGNPPSITIPPGQVFGGLNSIEYDYIDSSVASNASGDTEARVNAEFKVGNIPLFQFVAFYTKDLEIAPGANMNLIGRIHTNGDMYLSADGSLFSIVDDPTNGVNTVQVSAKGKIYRGRKRSTVCDAGQVSVDMLVDANGDGNLDPMGFNCNLPDTVSPSNGSGSTREALSSELSTWKGSMINHVESLAVPLPDIGARGNGVYWTRADLRIVLNLTTTTSVP